VEQWVNTKMAAISSHESCFTESALQTKTEITVAQCDGLMPFCVSQ
jgi:hypothetical protein